MNTRKIMETHNGSGTKGVKVYTLEDTKPENPEPDEFIKIQCEVVNTLEKQSSAITMTKEMYENFVKQGKKFVTLSGQFDSLEESGIDIDGDIVYVDGQKYAVNLFSWRK